MSVPYQVAGSLTFPPDTGAPNLVVQTSGSGQFASRQDGVLNLTGSGNKSVPFGTIPGTGAKGILIEVDPDPAPPARAPVIVKVNGSSTGGIEVAPGGSIVIHNPKPSSGITQLDIAYTTDNVVRYWLLGD